MSRIRTYKPEFLIHEELQELEIQYPGNFIMLSFLGLWSQCDSKGKFIYRPKHLKLAILPFIPFELSETLSILEENGFIESYEVNGKKYGRVINFTAHQRITGKEAVSGEKYPEPENNLKGNTGEAPENIPDAQEREREREKEQGKGKELSSTNVLLVDREQNLPTCDDEKIEPENDEDIEKPQKSPCPHKKIIALYHEILPMCPVVRDWHDTRRGLLKARWEAEENRQNIDWWKRFFEYVAESKFLTGQADPKPGAPPFIANLEWLVRPTNFAKVIEGNFHR